jgi:hypothetical protein
MNWVWAHSPTSGNERLVLLALADACSRDDGTGCWPSIATIARKANISERSVRRIIARLEEAGLLGVTRTSGGTARATNTYAIIMTPPGAKTAVSAPGPRQPDPGQDVTPDGSSGVTRQAPTPDTGVRPPLTPGSADPPENHQEPPPGGHADRASAQDHPGPGGGHRAAQTGRTARQLIAAYTASCAQRPPAAVLGQLGAHVTAMLAEGVDPGAIDQALKKFRTRPRHPSVLPSLVNQQLNPPASPADRPPADAAAVPSADPDDVAGYLAAIRARRYRTPAGPAPQGTGPGRQEARST